MKYFIPLLMCLALLNISCKNATEETPTEPVITDSQTLEATSEIPSIPVKDQALIDFASDYAASWSGQEASKVASFYAADGSLIVNKKEPAIGTAAITEVAQGFMSTFPDMTVSMDNLISKGDHLEFHWTLTGTNTAPGGTGNFVKISGYEVWTLNEQGQIQQSDGYFDGREYQKQLMGK